MNCPVAKLCGGCELLKVSYAKQGELKRENVQKLIDNPTWAIMSNDK